MRYDVQCPQCGSVLTVELPSRQNPMPRGAVCSSGPDYSKWKAETYDLRISGRHVRKATRVIDPEGNVVDLTEQVPKKIAVDSVIYQRSFRK